jgi:hypothetical protein
MRITRVQLILLLIVLIPLMAVSSAPAQEPSPIPRRQGDQGRLVPDLTPTAPYADALITRGRRAIAPAATSVAAFVGTTVSGPTDSPVLVTSFAEYQQQFGGLDDASPVSYAVRLFFDNGGARAWVVRADPATLPGGVAARTGIYALDGADPVNILCIPEISEEAVLAAAEQYCSRRRAFLLIDPPAVASTAAEATNWLSGPSGPPRTRDCATYFPWLVAADGRECGPSGAVAGAFARTDSARGVWKAPAGAAADLRGVASPAQSLTNTAAAALNQEAINPLREMSGRGLVVWGARTLSSDPEWKYIPVRRTALMIEESIELGTGWVVFEPNAEGTWARVRAQVSAFLDGLWRRGALQGATPRKAYFVRCDASTTTPADVAAGRLNILVGFAPTKPAEFIVLSITRQMQTP